MGNIINFMFGIPQNLRDVHRFGTTAATMRENVAEHSYYITLYAMCLMDRVRAEGHEVDGELLLKMCLIHDIPEGLTGDLIQRVKKEVRDVWNATELKIFKEWTGKRCGKQLADMVLDSFQRYQENDTIEAKIAHLADVLSALAFAFRQLYLGNKFFEPVCHRFERHVWDQQFLVDLRTLGLDELANFFTRPDFRTRIFGIFYNSN